MDQPPRACPIVIDLGQEPRQRRYLLVDLEQGVDKRSNARGGRKDQEQPEEQQNRDHRDQPPKLALPQEIQELSNDTYV